MITRTSEVSSAAPPLPPAPLRSTGQTATQTYRGSMAAMRVLQIGIDPAVVDFSPWPGQDADTLRERIATAEQSLRDTGYDVTVCLLPNDADTAGSAVRRYLAGGSYDVIEIGAGLRTSHAYIEIFERVVNTLLACQPGVRACFNDSPETTLDAVRRAFRH